MKGTISALFPVILGCLLLLVPTPEGLTPDAWRFFALFIAVVLALILEPIPAAASGLIGVVLATCFRLVPGPDGADATTSQALTWALSGFSNGVVWLIFVAFMFALGYEKTGLGKRISLLLIKKLGKSSLGLGYAVALADLALAPFMPSSTARSAGTIFPIVSNIPGLYGSTPDNEPRKLGAYLMWTGLAATCVTSSMFYTALAPNLLALSIVEKTVHFSFSWGEWFLNFLPVGLLLFAATPYLAYLLYPPTQKVSKEAPAWAAKELKAMGGMRRKEVIMALLAVLALLLWIFGGGFLDSTTTALVILCLIVLTGVLTWDDIVGYKQAWNVLVWFATLVTLAGGLGKTGFLQWFAKMSAVALSGFSPLLVLVCLAVLFFAGHYLFASVTAHVTALMAVFLSTAAAIPEVNLQIAAMLFCSSLGIMGIISPYATGPGPIWYGAGYIPQKTFWTLGALFGAIYLAVLLGIGLPWLYMRY